MPRDTPLLLGTTLSLSPTDSILQQRPEAGGSGGADTPKTGRPEKLLSGADAEVGDEREVVGGDERREAPVEAQAFEFERTVVVDVVEVHERERARVGAARPQVLAHVGAAQLLAEEAGGEPVRPLVEVAEDDARPRQLRVAEDVAAHQLAPLMPALDEGRAEVDV